MAQTSSLGPLTDGLVEVVTLYDKKQDARVLKACRDACNKNLRHHRFPRTNQFEVQQLLDGLIERFSITNKEPLAEALQSRLDELRSRDDRTTKWLPEVLSLFLHLADRPAELSSVERLAEIRPRTPPAEKLTWRDIFGEEDDMADAEGIKLQQQLGAESESDASFEEEAALSDAPDSDGSKTSLDVAVPSLKAADLIVSTNNAILDDLQQAHAWRQQAADGYALPIPEIEFMRECLNILRGLPSLLFEDFKPNGRYFIETLSSSVLHSLLSLFGATGKTFKQLSSITSRCKSPVQYTIWEQVERRLLAYRKLLANVEKSIADPQGPTVVSLLELQAQVDTASMELEQLGKIARTFQDDVDLLNKLYWGVHETQSTGQEGIYHILASILHACLKTYLRSVQRWMILGENDEHDATFFVKTSQEHTDLSSFWEKRYELRLQDGEPLTPFFLQPFVPTILSLGKQVAFLSELGLQKSLANAQSASFESDVTNLVNGFNHGDLTPYSSILTSALSMWIEGAQQSSTASLKYHLQYSLDLSRTLDALAQVYLFGNGSLTQAFAHRIFARIDAGRRSWDDPWFLEAAAQEAFAASPVVDATSLTVSAATPGTRHYTAMSDRAARKVNPNQKSVKALSGITMTLTIHAALQNIIRPQQLLIYQAAFTFLLQLHRGRSALADLDLRNLGCSSPRLSLPLRQRLLHILTTVTSHVLHAGIGAARTQLNADLEQAKGVDAMIACHGSFIRKLEHCCLLSYDLAVVQEAIVKLCDLAVAFVRGGSRPESKQTRPQKAHTDAGDDASETSDNEPVLGRSRTATAAQPAHENDPQTLRSMLRQCSQLQAVVVATLKSASRAGSGADEVHADISTVSSFLSMLAEELESSVVSRRTRS